LLDDIISDPSDHLSYTIDYFKPSLINGLEEYELKDLKTIRDDDYFDQIEADFRHLRRGYNHIDESSKVKNKFYFVYNDFRDSILGILKKNNVENVLLAKIK